WTGRERRVLEKRKTFCRHSPDAQCRGQAGRRLTAEETVARVCMIVCNDYLNDPRVRREAESLTERGDAVDCICLQNRKHKVASLRGVRLFGTFKKYRGSKRTRQLVAYLRFFWFAFVK